MKNRHLWTFLLTGAALGAFAPVGTPTAFAQTPEAEQSRDGDIVVTARRREETLIDVPIAVTAISGETLEETGAVDITAIGQVAPNVTLEVSRGTNTTLTAFIRGVGQQDPVAGFEQGVGLYLDDVYLNRPQAAVLDIYDVERVEVLRGPQGTLYGRNTIGGAIKYVTKRLSLEPELRVRGAYGSYNQADVVVSGSVPLGDTLRVGGAFAKLARDGFGTNLTTGADNYDKDVVAGRVSIEFEPTSNLLFRLSGDMTEDKSSPRQGYRLVPSIVQPNPLLPNRYDTYAGITNFAPFSANKVSAHGVQLLAEWQVNDWLTVKSITAQREDDTETPIDFDSTAAPTFDVPARYTNEQFSQEFQASVETDRFSGVLGYYYLDANAFNAFDVILTSISSFTLGDVDTKTWAVFGEFTYDVTDQLSVTLGGRYTEDERSAVVERELFLGTPSPYFGGTGGSLTVPVIVDGEEVVPRFEGTRQDDAFTPRVIVAYKVSDDLNLYASYSEGFKGGGFDPRGNFANPDVREGFLPEKVKSYELGAKTSLFDDRLQLNSAVFRADYTDVQIPGSVIITDSNGNTNFVGTVTNAGAAEFTGVELEGALSVTDALTLSGSLGYLDASYTEFIGAAGTDISDQRDVQNTPEWTGNAAANYTLPLDLGGREGALSLIGSAAYRGDSQQFEFEVPLLDQPAFWLYDASIVWTAADGVVRLGVHGKNLSDEDYIVSGYNFAGASSDNSILAFYGNPRTVTGTIDIRF